ncbi:MAG: hypothetical protein IKV86_00165, partial [Clostridia bacterium]|nr:hypothetical protein [Clostridia bacterium]
MLPIIVTLSADAAANTDIGTNERTNITLKRVAKSLFNIIYSSYFIIQYIVTFLKTFLKIICAQIYFFYLCSLTNKNGNAIFFILENLQSKSAIPNKLRY